MIVLSLSWQNGIVLSIKFSSCSSQRHTATKDVQNNGHDLLRRHRDLPDPVLCPRQRESTLAEQADVHEGQPDVVARREVRSVCAEKTPPFSAFPLMFYVCPEHVLANGHVTPSRSKLCVSVKSVSAPELCIFQADPCQKVCDVLEITNGRAVHKLGGVVEQARVIRSKGGVRIELRADCPVGVVTACRQRHFFV